MYPLQIHSTAATGRGSVRVVSLALALAGAVALLWLDRSHQRRRRGERSLAPPEPLQTWEAEGGGLPAGRGSNQPRMRP